MKCPNFLKYHTGKVAWLGLVTIASVFIDERMFYCLLAIFATVSFFWWYCILSDLLE